MGKEGRLAVRCSDFAFARFRFHHPALFHLQRLLIKSGRGAFLSLKLNRWSSSCLYFFPIANLRHLVPTFLQNLHILAHPFVLSTGKKTFRPTRF